MMASLKEVYSNLMSPEDLVSFKNEKNQEGIIERAFGKTPMTFTATILSGLPEQTADPNKTGADGTSEGAQFWFSRIRDDSNHNNFLNNPFDKKISFDKAKKLINLHPLAYAPSADLEGSPNAGEKWECRYVDKTRTAITIVKKIGGDAVNMSMWGGETLSGEMTNNSGVGTVSDYLANAPSSLIKNVTWGGKPKKLMVGYTGVSPSGFWKQFRKDLQSYIRSNYPELGFKIANLGVIRPLADSAAASNPDRADGSKHGAGLAQDLYLHTDTYGEYKSYKTWNPILAKDIRLVRLMRKFAADRPEIQWGGNFGGGTGDIVQGRGITEFHHYEFKDSVMPKYFAPYDAEIQRVSGGSLSAADLTSTNVLAKLYGALT
tara:strand:- start:3150 stop:4277 length:1128 start_codon:yes stop_codon:yes gene_type:complete